jgi:hypothetical protein
MFEDLVSLYLENNTTEYHYALNNYCEVQDEDPCEIHLKVLSAAKEVAYAF